MLKKIYFNRKNFFYFLSFVLIYCIYYLIVPPFEYPDFDVRIERLSSSIFFNYSDQFNLIKECKYKIYEYFKIKYFDCVELEFYERYKISYLLICLTYQFLIFLVFLNVFFTKISKDKYILKFLIFIFFPPIIFLNFSIHESYLVIILFSMIFFFNNIKIQSIIFLNIIFIDYEYILPILIFLFARFVLKNFSIKEVIFIVAILFYLFHDDFGIFTIFEVQKLKPQYINEGYLEFAFEKSILIKYIYSIYELVGNFNTSIMFSSNIFALCIIFLLYNSKKLSFFKDKKILEILLFLIIWIICFENYIDVRFFVFCIPIIIETLIKYVKYFRLLLSVIFYNLLILCEIFIKII